MSEIEAYEVLIVGGGRAGQALAEDLAREGRRVAMIERGMFGGTCINLGCIPTKTLVASAAVADAVARAKTYGVRVDGWRTDLAGVLANERSVVTGLADMIRHHLQEALGEHFILGEARFVAPRTIEVAPANGAPRRFLAGEKVFVNLGARPAMPSIPGLAEASPLTSEAALALDALPEHLVILGGGFVGVELGQVFRRLGSRVTIVQREAHLLPNEDTDVSEAIDEIFREDGIEVVLGAEVLSVTGRSGTRVHAWARVAEGERVVEGTDLLVAVGRVPMTRGIGLEAAGIELDARGFIRVNDRLETTASSTWALGDCACSPQQTHVSLDDYRIVKANVFGAGGRRTTDRLIPHTVFIDPELGRVGLTEREARARGLATRVATLPTASVLRARTLGQTRGFLKAIVDARSSRILGFAMLGPQAAEVTAVVHAAMLGDLPYTRLRDAVLAHPTMAESLNALFASIAGPLADAA